jgi:hypothetical protein
MPRKPSRGRRKNWPEAGNTSKKELRQLAQRLKTPGVGLDLPASGLPNGLRISGRRMAARSKMRIGLQDHTGGPASRADRPERWREPRSAHLAGRSARRLAAAREGLPAAQFPSESKRSSDDVARNLPRETVAQD